MNKARLSIIGLAFLLGTESDGIGATPAAPFTYQGQLKQDGLPAKQTCDFQFALFDSKTDGNEIGLSLLKNGIGVVNGLFDVEVDFGADVFSGGLPWMEVSVRCPAGSGAFTTLGPRQHITGTPFSIATRGLFVDDNENVGIGTTSPAESLEVRGNIRAARDDGAETQLIVESQSATGPPHLTMQKARGSLVAPTPVSADDQLGEINFNGWDGNRWFVAAGISASAVEGFTPTWHPSSLEFATTPAGGGGRLQRMSIDENGNVGIGTTAPQAKLEVAGGEVRFPGGTNPGGAYTNFNDSQDGKNHIRGTTIMADNGGNVGIGMTNPTQKLDVAGIVKVQGLQFPDGTIQSSAASSLNPGIRGSQLFDTPGSFNWTCPAGVTAVLVEAVSGAGGSGGGGSRASSHDGGGGGGGGSGGYWRGVVATNPGQTYNIVVGGGGAAGLGGVQPANGTPGGDGGVTRLLGPGGAILVEITGGLSGAAGISGASGGIGGAGGAGGMSTPINALRVSGQSGEPGYSGSDGGYGGETSIAVASYSLGGDGGDGGMVFDPNYCETTAECVNGCDGDNGDDGFLLLQW
ncbi:MAG: hypothetical protein HY287_03800 [Planctomycetes bacterium]|nr:hypothetical protein [Planctomycetota bacterium]MBI3833436.1 hypothetical protein [Planctomycetota bacterium]